MKIILLKDVKKIGKKFDVKDAAEGYALNYLIPNGFAVPATPSYTKMIEEKKKQDALLKESFKSAFEYALSELPEGKLQIKGKANDKGHLFAGITKTQVIEEFKKQTGVTLSDEHFDLEKSLKELGEHTLDVKVEDKEYKLKINISAE